MIFSKCDQIFFSFIVILGMTASASAQDGYFTGGEEPLPPVLQMELDKRADKLRLGFNTTFMKNSGYDPILVTPVIIDAIDQLDEQKIPGMVILFDSFDGDNMPVAIGSMMIDPEDRPVEWSTVFDLDQLAGPVMTLPFLLRAAENRELDLGAQAAGLSLHELIMHRHGWRDVEKLMKQLLADSPREISDDHHLEFAHDLEKILSTQRSVTKKSVLDPGYDFFLISRILADDSEETFRSRFMNDFGTPLGMMNTITGDFISSWRRATAPGKISDLHSHMTWGESSTPSIHATGEHAIHGGMFSTVDDLSLYARFMIASWQTGTPDNFSSETVRMMTQPFSKPVVRDDPDPHSPEFAYSLSGWQTGIFGEKSFGWTTHSGRALWIDPETNKFCIILSNPEHPYGLDKDYISYINSILFRLHQCIINERQAAFAIPENKKKTPRKMTS